MKINMYDFQFCKRCKNTEDGIYYFSKVVQGYLCKDCQSQLDYQIAALSNNFMQTQPLSKEELEEHLLPPPWDWIKYKEKTEGWNEFQIERRKHPEYYK